MYVQTILISAILRSKDILYDLRVRTFQHIVEITFLVQSTFVQTFLMLF